MEQTQSLARVGNTQMGTRPPIFTAASRVMDCFPKFTAGLWIVFSHIASQCFTFTQTLMKKFK